MIIGKHIRALGLAASVIGASVLGAVPAMAQATGQSTEPPTTFDRLEKALSDAAAEAMDYVSSFIPYKMPEVQPNGDIVIRRDTPATGATTEAEAAPTGPSTTTPGTGTTPPDGTKI